MSESGVLEERGVSVDAGGGDETARPDHTPGLRESGPAVVGFDEVVQRAEKQNHVVGVVGRAQVSRVTQFDTATGIRGLGDVTPHRVTRCTW